MTVSHMKRLCVYSDVNRVVVDDDDAGPCVR